MAVLLAGPAGRRCPAPRSTASAARAWTRSARRRGRSAPATADLMLAGGVESMTRAPFVMPKAESAFSRANAVYDTTIGWRFVNPKMKKEFGVDSMPQTADNVAADFGVSPRRPGRLRRAQPGPLGGGAGGRQVPRRDRAGDDPAEEGRARSSSTPTSIRARAPPPRRWPSSRASTAPTSRVTAGNASGVNDGAAALVLASEAAAKAHGPDAEGARRRHGRGRRRAADHGHRPGAGGAAGAGAGRALASTRWT